MIKLNKTVNTAGDGYWSTVSKSVTVTEMYVSYMNEDRSFGELRVYFTLDSWNPSKDGLIYTDSLFLKELQLLLKQMGYDVEEVGYSEQGMQGKNFVSLDVGESFLNDYRNLFH